MRRRHLLAVSLIVLAAPVARPAAAGVEEIQQRARRNLPQHSIRQEVLLEREGGSDLFSYLPELRTVRRLTGRAISGSLFGTDFSYEDLERIQVTADTATAELLPETEIEGRKVDVVAATLSPGSGSAYARVVTYVDRETCVAARTDLEGQPGAPAKQVSATFAEVRKVGDRWVPHLVSIEDRETGRRTQLTVRRIDLDVNLSQSEFSEAALTKGH